MNNRMVCDLGGSSRVPTVRLCMNVLLFWCTISSDDIAVVVVVCLTDDSGGGGGAGGGCGASREARRSPIKIRGQ